MLITTLVSEIYKYAILESEYCKLISIAIQ